MKFIVRSLLILIALYGLVFAVGDAYLSHASAPLWLAVVFAIVFIGLQYLVAPRIIDFVMSIYWIDLVENTTELPDVNRAFIQRLCAERGLRVPRIGIIYSRTPNAFSYGRTPADARVVITTGLLEILTPDEANAVLAHELGHVEHWDFVVMTVAAVVPLVLYQLYAFGRRFGNSFMIAEGAYTAYLLSRFVVLLLNRTREYFADHYAAEVTHAPNALSSALVKIALGLVRVDGEFRGRTEEGSTNRATMTRDRRLAGALALMGISNVRSGAALALGGADATRAAAVMRWDLANPWARLYELQSTHPLTALRVRALGRSATAMHQTIEYTLPEQTRVAWGSFPLEVLLWAAPVVSGVAWFVAMLAGKWLRLHGIALSPYVRPDLLALTGATWMVRTWYRYRGAPEPATVGALIEDVTVSEMRPRAVRIEGEILGRGVPGAFWSPDLVMRDATGMLFVLYRQSIPFARLLFAFTAARACIGQRVTIDGWFRRGIRPYVEMSALTTQDGVTHHAYSRWVQYATAAALIAGSAYWHFVS